MLIKKEKLKSQVGCSEIHCLSNVGNNHKMSIDQFLLIQLNLDFV